MIRNVVLVRMPADASAEDFLELRAGLDGIASLDLPGLLDNHVGLDERLREAGWDAAITNDWVDEDAYRAYDLDEEHQRYRTQIQDVSAEVARVQFRITGTEDLLDRLGL